MTKRRKSTRVAKRAPRPATHPALDTASGNLKLDGWDTTLGPQLTRSAFLGSALGRAMKNLIVNEPWHSWQLRSARIGDREFLVGVFFEGEKLDMVQMFLQDSRYGTSWADFSPEKEKARHAAQQRWLRDQFAGAGIRLGSGNERKFPWGEAGVYCDPRNEEFSIVVSYRT